MSQIELSEIYRKLRLSTLDENKKPMGVNKVKTTASSGGLKLAL